MSAYFSPCRTWRYSLTRDVGIGGSGTVTFIGLNPSTADETVDDPTIRRCIRFARDWRFARLKMLNLYAYRATDPRELHKAEDPVGPENDHVIAQVVGGSDLVVCAWGAFKENRTMIVTPRGRAAVVRSLISAPYVLGLTKDGHPRHPLYVRADTFPVPLR